MYIHEVQSIAGVDLILFELRIPPYTPYSWKTDCGPLVTKAKKKETDNQPTIEISSSNINGN